MDFKNIRSPTDLNLCPVYTMPFMLEKYGDKAIVVNTKTHRHYSTTPIPIQSAKRQMRLLQQVSEKKDMKK
jgi:hypothetical protein